MTQQKSPRLLALRALAVTALALAAFAIPASDPAAAGNQDQQRVTVTFRETPITDAASAVQMLSGVNVAVHQGVDGAVTVTLRDIPLLDALGQIAAMVGAEVRRFGNTYFIGRSEDLKEIAARTGATETVSLRWVDAETLTPILESTFPYVTVSGQAGHLVLRGDAADLAAAREIVARHDVQPAAAPPSRKVVTYLAQHVSPQELAGPLQPAYPNLEFQILERVVRLTGLEAEVDEVLSMIQQLDQEEETQILTTTYRLSYLNPLQAAETLEDMFEGLTARPGPEHYGPSEARLRTISVESQATFGQGGGAGGGGGQGGGQAGGQTEPGAIVGPGARSRHLVLYGPQPLVEAALALLQETDTAPEQILIEARVVDVSPERLRDVGLEWEWTALPFRIPASHSELGLTDIPPSGSAGRVGKIQRGPFDFFAILNLMERRRDARLLASPNILVLDSEEASIFIGDLLRFRTLASVTTVGEQFTIQEVPVGIALLVRPRVTGEDEITLRVHPAVSTVTDLVGPERIPQTASREADSTIRLRDGETMVIGGLIRDEEIRTMSKIPLLGDLPLLGELFRNRTRERRQSEITVFLTARIVRDDDPPAIPNRLPDAGGPGGAGNFGGGPGF